MPKQNKSSVYRSNIYCDPSTPPPSKTHAHTHTHLPQRHIYIYTPTHIIINTYTNTHTHTHTHTHMVIKKNPLQDYKAVKKIKINNHSSGAVWESRWTSWNVRPNEPSGFRGRKDLLNHASALVCLSLICQPTSEDIKHPFTSPPRPHSSGAVWESRWPSQAVRPSEPSGFRGRKAILNHASALVSACP